MAQNLGWKFKFFVKDIISVARHEQKHYASIV